MTESRSVPCPTSIPTLSAVPLFRTARTYAVMEGIVICFPLSGISSSEEKYSCTAASQPGSDGRRETPQFPQISVVTPCASLLSTGYAAILAEGRITIGIICREQNAHESCHQLEALEPLWEADPVELPETPADFGGGKLTVHCRYGTIEADKENATYYKGNMASSGLEIRINGRCIERGLYSKVFGKALHPSCNRFLAQIDLRGEDGVAFPATETTKNAFVEGDARTQALFRWIRANVRQPETSRESLESRLVGKLAEKKAAERDTLRIGREEGTYRTIGLQGKIDLLVSKTDGMTIYEAKAKGTKAEDLYQLRLYADGCAMDGVPAKESVLIGARHPKEVCSLAEQLNSQCDPTGAPYHFVLRTWTEEGISA